MDASWRVGLSRDLLDAAGRPCFGEAPLERPGFEFRWLDASYPEFPGELAREYDALYVNSARVSAQTVAFAREGRLKVIARHGVGYDSVDVAALDASGVVLLNTPHAVRRPVATIAITFVLALAQRLFAKDRLTRSGRWAERTSHMGMGLTGRRLGIVGGGGIGRELARLARAFELEVAIADPYVAAGEIEALGARLQSLDGLMAESDFIVVACLLNEETRGLINEARLARMKPTAYLINVARGPIVKERALIEALRGKRIAGAALDVFEQEPVAPDNPLLSMPEVIVTPHSLCWTDECFGAIATEAFDGLAALMRGQVPHNVVNRRVLEHPRVRAWLHSAR